MMACGTTKETETMMHDREPIIVQGPSPITPLAAAMIALGDTSSKVAYLEPRVRERLFMHIRQLEEENESLRESVRAAIRRLEKWND